MTNVVVDTSVVISALIGKQGPGRKLLRCCLQGEYQPLISNALFAEYEAVSQRDEIVRLCPLSKDEKRRLFNAFYNICQWTSIHYLWRPNIKDEADNFLVELAVAGNAEYIVTNNIRDFDHAELIFPDLTIITPEQLFRGN
jgi:putative PIN family toxin of toxin-antitoxin system